MELTLKTKVIIVIVYTAVVFACGRFSVTETIKTQVKLEETRKIDDNTKRNEQKDTHKKIVTVEEVKPTGEKQITTTETEDTVTVKKEDEVKKTDDVKKEDKTTEVTKQAGKINISALVGANVVTGQASYGVGAIFPIAGPLTIGAFAFNTGQIGASVGISF